MAAIRQQRAVGFRPRPAHRRREERGAASIREGEDVLLPWLPLGDAIVEATGEKGGACRHLLLLRRRTGSTASLGCKRRGEAARHLAVTAAIGAATGLALIAPRQPVRLPLELLPSFVRTPPCRRVCRVWRRGFQQHSHALAQVGTVLPRPPPQDLTLLDRRDRRTRYVERGAANASRVD